MMRAQLVLRSIHHEDAACERLAPVVLDAVGPCAACSTCRPPSGLGGTVLLLTAAGSPGPTIAETFVPATTCCKGASSVCTPVCGSSRDAVLLTAGSPAAISPPASISTLLLSRAATMAAFFTAAASTLASPAWAEASSGLRLDWGDGCSCGTALLPSLVALAARKPRMSSFAVGVLGCYCVSIQQASRCDPQALGVSLVNVFSPEIGPSAPSGERSISHVL